MDTADRDRALHEREIIDLTVRYAWAIDDRCFADLGAVFAPDATADYGRMGVFHGLDAITEAVSGALARFARTQHIVLNHQVTIDGDRARGRCYFQAQHVAIEAGAERNHMVAGSYLDEFGRTGDGWRIASRTLRVTWREPAEPGPGPLSHHGVGQASDVPSDDLGGRRR